MIAEVLQWPVETGMPVRLANSSVKVVGEVSGYALVLLELDHVHANRFDDALAAHDGAK